MKNKEVKTNNVYYTTGVHKLRIQRCEIKI